MLIAQMTFCLDAVIAEPSVTQELFDWQLRSVQ
jgi:hypothetical protein